MWEGAFESMMWLPIHGLLWIQNWGVYWNFIADPTASLIHISLHNLSGLNQYESAALMAANKAASAFDTAEESSDIIIDDRQPKKTGSKTPAAPMEKNDARLGSKEHVATVSPDPAPGKCN